MPSNPGPIPPLSPIEMTYRRRGRGPAWVWVLGVVGLGTVVACVWGVVVVLGPHLAHDRPELIENPPVTAALEEPCAAVQEAAAQVDLEAPAAERAAQLTVVATAIDHLAAAVGELSDELLDSDLPTRYWVADWETLGTRLTDYSVALASGGPAELDTPLTRDGYTVVTRMDLAAPLGCEVPPLLVALDPTPPPAPAFVDDEPAP